ncbi:MAG: helix-turn-helix domain-containing protein, partial [Maricaulaceae bacterium]
QEELSELLETACRQLVNNEDEGEGETLYQQAMNWVEKPLIIEALRVTGGNRAKAADLLGIHRNTLRTRLKKLDIS